MFLGRCARVFFVGGLVFFQVYTGRVDWSRANEGKQNNEAESPPKLFEVSTTREPGDLALDEEAYKNIFLKTRREHSGGSDQIWKLDALGRVLEWENFIKEYSNSKLVPQAHIRMAEWYLTITTEGDARTTDPMYAREALRLLNDVIKNYPKYDYLAYLGDKKFAYRDTVEAFAIFTRGQFFSGYCKSDYARLKRDYPNSPLTSELDISFKKICRTP